MKSMLAQAPIKAIGDHFHKGGDTGELLFAALTLVALVALLVAVHKTMNRRAAGAATNNPQRLFRSVIGQLGLNVRDRDLLRRLSADLRLDQPVVLLLSPIEFRRHAVRWLAAQSASDAGATQRHVAHLDALSRLLFEESFQQDAGDRLSKNGLPSAERAAS